MCRSAHFFLHYAPDDVPFGKKSAWRYCVVCCPSHSLSGYCDETKRLYGVLDIALNGRDWFVGPQRGTFTIADMNVLPW